MPEQSEQNPQQGSNESTRTWDKLLSTRVSRRRALTATAEGLTAAAIFAACGGGSKSGETGSETPQTETTLPAISIESLPGGVEHIYLGNARPVNLVMRQGSQMAVAGAFKDESGVDQVLFAITDPKRKNQDGSPVAFKGFLPLLPQSQETDKITSFSSILSANGGSYDEQKGIVTLKDGKKGKLQTLDQATVFVEKAKAGVLFVDVDPLKKDHPLLDKPVITTTDKSILPEGGTITQLEDGRVVTKDANGTLIARAITQRGLDWRWTKKEHLINDYSPSELADALGIVIQSVALLPDITNNPDFKENALSIANRLKIPHSLYSVNMFSKSINWREILNDWDNIRTELSKGNIPNENMVINSSSVSQTEQLFDFAKKYNMDVVGAQLFWWSDLVDGLKSSNFTLEEKRKMIEFMTKAKVLKYKGRIKQWIGASEVAFSEVAPWIPAETKKSISDLGGRKLIHDVFTWAKEADPTIELTLIDTDVIDPNNPLYKQVNQAFFGALSDLKAMGTPIDKVAEEINVWIYAPPSVDDIRTFVQRVQKMGYKVGAAETTIAVSETYPWTARPRTIQTVANQEDAQAKIARDIMQVYYEEGAEFGVFSGADANTWFNYQNRADTLPEIVDKNYKPKKAFVEIVKYLKSRLVV